MRWLPFLFLTACSGSAGVGGLGSSSPPRGAPIVLSWVSPIEYEDRTPLWNLAGFRIYANASLVLEINDRRAVSAEIYVEPGDVIWMTAFDVDGVESSPSASVTVP